MVIVNTKRTAIACRLYCGRLLAGVLLAALLLSASGCAQTAEPAVQLPTWQEQYDLGMRYLSDGSYAEAILAFTAAIEIDPKQATLYSSRAEAYKLAAKQIENNELSVEYYEKAIADYEEAARLGDASAEAKANELLGVIERMKTSSEAKPLLETLYQMLEQGDLEQAKTLMRREEYRALSASAGDGALLYEGSGDLVLAAYDDDYYYFGQWSNDQRSGQGLWLRAVFDNDHDLYTYQGSWANDLPNGEGVIVDQRDAEQIQVEPGHTTSIRTEITGTFKDGMYDGIIHEIWYMNDGDVHTWSPITVVDGVYQPMPDIPESIRQRGYYEGKINSGSVLVAIDTGNGTTDLWSTDRVHKVEGIG